jgi:hypothetical protein
VGVKTSNLCSPPFFSTHPCNILSLWLMQKYSYELHSVFHNLTNLELTLNFMPNYGMLKWSWLIKLLQNFPLLQTLIIDEVSNFKFCHVFCFFFSFLLFSLTFIYFKKFQLCIIVRLILYTISVLEGGRTQKSHLTTCSLRSYSRINCELQFAKYIMQNSRVLSIMKIQSAKFLDTNTKIQMSLELSSFPMNSTICQLLFIWMIMYRACVQ